MLEEKRYVFEPGSTATVNCSIEETDFGQNFSWYDHTGFKNKSRDRKKLSGFYLEIKSVQLDDAGKYECRGISNSRNYTIVVACEFSLCLCCPLSLDYFPYILPLLNNTLFRGITLLYD